MKPHDDHSGKDSPANLLRELETLQRVLDGAADDQIELEKRIPVLDPLDDIPLLDDLIQHPDIPVLRAVRSEPAARPATPAAQPTEAAGTARFSAANISRVLQQSQQLSQQPVQQPVPQPPAPKPLAAATAPRTSGNPFLPQSVLDRLSRAQRTSGTAGNTSSATHGGRRYSAFQRRQHQPRAATVSAAITTTRTATGTATAGTQTPGRSHRPAHVRQPLPAAVGTRPPEQCAANQRHGRQHQQRNPRRPPVQRVSAPPTSAACCNSLSSYHNNPYSNRYRNRRHPNPWPQPPPRARPATPSCRSRYSTA